ncbi:MAG: hypothetical protein WC971_04710 [Coriobacteriia bacterium]
MGAVPEPTGTTFISWLTQYGNIILFFAQMLFWIAVAVAAVWAAWELKRLVDHKVGKAPKAKKAEMDAEAADEDKSVSVEEFVE